MSSLNSMWSIFTSSTHERCAALLMALPEEVSTEFSALIDALTSAPKEASVPVLVDMWATLDEALLRPALMV